MLILALIKLIIVCNMIADHEEAAISEFWREVSALFSEALELPPSLRDGFLAGAANVETEAEVRRLLGEHERLGQFLALPALRAGSDENDPASVCFESGEVLVGRFRVDRLLGKGGMGEVYQTFDTKLAQNVAIKTLRSPFAGDPDMARQFCMEVLRSRQITHRNVCRVHDLFTHRTGEGRDITFFTMELIQGETLAERLDREGPFKPDQALPLLEQMAAALDAAHSAGIIHRDFKPANVFLVREPDKTSDQAIRVKVTDFGIAGETGNVAHGELSPTRDAGTVGAGTPAYMAPEQLNGESSSVATDVYALGLVTLEMLTGRCAYGEQSPLLSALKKCSGENPHLCEGQTAVPARWAKCIDRALRSEPKDRFRSALDLTAALRGKAAIIRRRIARSAIAAVVTLAAILTAWMASNASQKTTTIAVLPFTGGGSDQTYLGQGVAEDLERGLSTFPNMQVEALEASAAYQKKTTSMREIAKGLGVKWLLTGSLRQTGHRVHLWTQLTEGEAGKQLWSRTYDFDAEELLNVQRDILQTVATRLKLGKQTLSATREPTANEVAYDLFLRGRYLANKRTREGLMKSLEYFEQATGLDKNFALAYTGIAQSYEALFEYGWMSAADSFSNMQAAIQRALALAPDDAQTQACLGLIYNKVEWHQGAAERAFLRALSLDPNLPDAHHWYSSFLWRAGRFDEGLREAEDARRLDPVTIPTLLSLAWVHYGRREYPQTIKICQEALELNPAYSSAYQLMAQAYADSKQTDRALAASRETQRLDTDRAVALRHRALVLSRLPNQQDEARRIAGEMEAASPDRQEGYLARIYGALHDRDRMYFWAERALESHDVGLMEWKVDPALDTFRNEPAFQQILARLGLQ